MILKKQSTAGRRKQVRRKEPLGMEIKEKLEQVVGDSPYKLVLSKVRKGSDNPYIKINILKKTEYFQAECYTATQVFHKKLREEELLSFCVTEAEQHFQQLNAWSEAWEYQLMISKKGAPALKKKQLRIEARPEKQLSHNREKKYLLEEGNVILPLVDMGVFSPEGKVLAGKYDKFKQINRFAEIIDDALKTYRHDPEKPLKVIDFGCGKSYLTFVLYYFLTEVRGLKVKMIGLDLKTDVIRKCNEAAKKYGYSDLSFQVGDIGCYKDSEPADMVITLHACDTATDHALFHAVNWKAKMIFSVPCCQHELNKQFETDNFKLLGRYGIVKERMCALMTDAIRANLLEYCGYRTQVMEFVDFENTPKNLLIRAIRRDQGDNRVTIDLGTGRSSRDRYLAEAKELMEQFSFSPTFYGLLRENGYIQEG